MCAIAGLWLKRGAEPSVLRALAQRMADHMAHRGPDGSGVWVDAAAGLALAHRRLAVMDLSPAAAQPMVSEDGVHALVYNGEIYNHLEWRDQLHTQGHLASPAQPRSRGDTETLLRALRAWGAERCCRQSHGMFAWAWFDARTGRLTLARDRLGKKPLVVASGPWGMAFASELSALLQLPMVERTVDAQALDHYLRWGHAPVDHTLILGISRVAPGEIQTWEQARCVQRQRYWQAPHVAAQGRCDRLGDPEQALGALDETLRSAVRDRLLSDAPVGAFLSGGIDSSLVVALMQQEGSGRTKTFSIGFDDPACDESLQARAIAGALGTDHHAWTVCGADAKALMSELAHISDEPLGDASQLPTTLLALHARSSVTVALTGDGGDEAFGGYPRYRQDLGLLAAVSRLPLAVRERLADGIGLVRPAHWARLAGCLPERIRPTLPASKADKLQRWLRAPTSTERLYSLMERWDPTGLRGSPVRSPQACGEDALQGLSTSERMQLQEMQEVLSADLLAKMDRATMWASMEARSPLLDDRVIELAWRLPPSLKAEGPRGKEILRRLLARYLDPRLFDRPKRGFSAPLARWMDGELRAPVGELLNSLSHHTRGRWQTGLIDQAWQSQRAGTTHEVDRLWSLVALEAWRQRWGLELP